MKPKVLVLSGGDTPEQQSLQAIAFGSALLRQITVTEKEFPANPTVAEQKELSACFNEYTHLFIAPEVFSNLLGARDVFDSLPANTVFFLENSIAYTDIFQSQSTKSLLEKHSTIFLQAIRQTHLQALLKNTLLPNSHPSLIPFLDRQTNLYFEKIQSLNEVGSLADRIVNKITRDHALLKKRTFDIRIVFQSLLSYAFDSCVEANHLAPVAPLQIALSDNQFLLTTSLPLKPNIAKNIRRHTLEGAIPTLYDTWRTADFLHLNYFPKLEQLEVKVGISSNVDRSNQYIRSLTSASASPEDRIPNLLHPPQNMEIYFLSDLDKGMGQAKPISTGQAKHLANSLAGQTADHEKANKLKYAVENSRIVIGKLSSQLDAVTKQNSELQSLLDEYEKNSVDKSLKQRLMKYQGIEVKYEKQIRQLEMKLNATETSLKNATGKASLQAGQLVKQLEHLREREKDLLKKIEALQKEAA